MKTRKIWLMLAPSLFIIGLFLCAVLYSALLSFNFFSIVPDVSIGVEPYFEVLTNKTFLKSLLFSLYFSFLATFISLILAVIISFSLGDVVQGEFRSRKMFTFLYGFNQPIPHIVSAFVILMLLSQSGIASRVLFSVGMVGEPSSFPILVYDKMGMGIIVSFVWKFVPFIGIQVLAIVRAIGNEYSEVAKTLGANRIRRWWYVLLPLAIPSMVSSSILTFAYAFGSFEVPFALSGTNPKAIAVLAYEKYISSDLNARAEAAVICNVITVVTVFLVVVYLAMLQKQKRVDIHV